LVKQVAEMLVRIAERGVSILLVEQKLTIALTISRRVYVMGHGRVVFEGAPDDLRRAENGRKEWLEVERGRQRTRGRVQVPRRRSGGVRVSRPGRRFPAERARTADQPLL